MHRQSSVRMKAFAVALGVAAMAAAAVPKDPCALLKPADIQPLASDAKIGNGVAENSELGAGCTYSWGPRNSQWGQTTLGVAVVYASKMWPGGLTADDIKQRVAAEAGSGGLGSSPVAGIGEGAVFTTAPKSNEAMVKAYFVKAKDVVLQVTFHGGNAAGQKDKLIALAKAAAAAL